MTEGTGYHWSQALYAIMRGILRHAHRLARRKMTEKKAQRGCLIVFSRECVNF
jgi:hypothetical protein